MPDSDAAPAPLSPDATVFGIDYGSRRIGLAIGGLRLRDARPLGTMDNVNGTPAWQALDAHVNQWQPTAFVVGWPLEQDGSEPAIIAHVKGFVRRLRQRYDRPVYTIDERYSSMAAQQRVAEQRRDGRRKKRSTHADIDAEAASVILRRWLDTQPADADTSAQTPGNRPETSR